MINGIRRDKSDMKYLLTSTHTHRSSQDAALAEQIKQISNNTQVRHAVSHYTYYMWKVDSKKRERLVVANQDRIEKMDTF